MARRKFLETLHERVLVGDGAMGTLLYARGVEVGTNYDSLNLVRPWMVQSVHADYVKAGADLIETNTYGANRLKLEHFKLESKVREINLAGTRLAREVAGDRIFVGGAVGPLGRTEADREGLSVSDMETLFTEQIEALAEGGCDAIQLETFYDLEELLCALRVAKRTNLPVICQMTFTDLSITSKGRTAIEVVRVLEREGADVIGANCGRGPKVILKVMEKMARATPIPLSAFPNAGFPEYVDGRYMYLSTPEYLASTALEIMKMGANLVGGCCGTTPDDIEAVARRLKNRSVVPRTLLPESELEARPKAETPDVIRPRRVSFLEKVTKKKLVLVEIDPPKGVKYEKYIAGARKLVDAGVDAITTADNSLAQVRMSNIAFAVHMMKETGAEVVLHLSCRDKNLIALQSELMGVATLGLSHVLAITGDPASVGPQPGAKSVFDMNSASLIDLMAKMNQGVNLAGDPIGKKTSFVIGCSFNPNVPRMEHQVKKLETKKARGAHFVMTQPVFLPEKVFEMLERTAPIGLPVFVGVLPLLSYKNAVFLHNEVPGIQIPEEIQLRMKEAPQEEAKQEGIRICQELVEKTFSAVAGFYFIPPFSNADHALPLVEHIRQLERAQIVRKP